MTKHRFVVIAIALLGVVAVGGCASAQPKAAGDCKATVETHAPIVYQSWQIKGDGPKIVNFWSNQPRDDQVEHKLYLAAEESARLFGGGTLYSYPVGCEKQAKQEFASNTLSPITIEQLRDRGLVREFITMTPDTAAPPKVVAVKAEGEVAAVSEESEEGDVCRLKQTIFGPSSGGKMTVADPEATEHVDFYPRKGVKAISYIVGPQSSVTWSGYGSIWSEGPNCQNFDWVADATEYARGRLTMGHSGVVIDLRDGKKVVANLRNLPKDELQRLVAAHNVGQAGESSR